MYIEVKGCIYPNCEGGIKCPVANPPERCELDLTDLDKLVIKNDKLNAEDYKIVLAGKEALKRIAKRKNQVRSRIFYEEHKEERRAYTRERYKRLKEAKLHGTNQSN